MWQELIVGGCVLIAGWFVLRRFLPTGKGGATACGNCRGCGQNGRQCK